MASGEAADRERRVAMYSALLVAWLGWMFDGLEMGLYSWAVPPALKQFMGTADSATIGPYLSITVALFLLGMSAGGVVFGRLGDRIGRVKTMIATVLVYAIFTGLSGFCHNIWQLGACRFLGAMGLGGEWGLGVALVMETWPNTSRPLLAGLLGGAANVGFLVAAWLTKWLAGHPMVGQFENWRIALMLGFVPALLTLVVRLFVRESERWLQVREKSLQAKFSDLFRGELRRQSLIGIAVSAVAVLGMWGVFQAWLQAWVQNLVEAMPGATPESVGLARAHVGLYMALGAIVGSVAAGPLAQTMGRRASYALFCVGSLISAGLLYGTCDAMGPQLLSLTCLGGAFSAAFFGWLPLYLPELFPTHIRATGEGLTFNAGRILSAVGVLLTGALSKSLGGPDKASLLMSSIFVVGLVVAWFIPETKGQELPE